MAAFTRNAKTTQKDIELSTTVLDILQENLKKWRHELVLPEPSAHATSTHTGTANRLGASTDTIFRNIAHRSSSKS